jgi:hypothetical protein
MKVCDRCKNQLDTNRESILNGNKVELCSSCSEYILNHIKNYNPKKTGLGKLFS